MIVIGLSIEFDNGEALMFPNEYVEGDCSLGFCGKEEKLGITDGNGAQYYRAEAITISIDRDVQSIQNGMHKKMVDCFYKEYGKSDTPYGVLLSYLYNIQSDRYIRSFQRILSNEKENVYHLCAWGGEDEYINHYQQIKMNKHGDLFIVISEDMTLIDRMYPDDVINADNYEVACFQSFGRAMERKRKDG